MSLNKYKRTLSFFINKINLSNLKDFQISRIPPPLMEYFKLCSESIQHEKTIADTWQAGSRAKDPTGKNRSIIYCLGFNDQDVVDITKWGANIHYTRQMRIKRISSRQEYMIIPPYSIRISDCLDDMQVWLDGGQINPVMIGFGKDIYADIMRMLMYEEEVTSEEMWLNIDNLPVGRGSPDHKNGYLVGTIRALIKSGTMQELDVKETAHGEFTFQIGTTPPSPNPAKFDVDLVCKVLRLSYLNEKDRRPLHYMLVLSN